MVVADVEVVAFVVELPEVEGDAARGRVVVKFVVVVKVLGCLFVPRVTTVDTEREVMTVWEVALAEELAEDYEMVMIEKTN